ncbi:MAG: hypothetical protein HC781_21390 [Leptolyngbyaceae cyanobacterium CSU_1_4]|nr:hypothetical protein [Leptolyngbyaceae cyanobacterium CSU_1_4]
MTAIDRHSVGGLEAAIVINQFCDRLVSPLGHIDEIFIEVINQLISRNWTYNSTSPTHYIDLVILHRLQC